MMNLPESPPRWPSRALHATLILALMAGFWVASCKSDEPATAQSVLLESGARLSEIVESQVADPERARAAVEVLTVFRARQTTFVDDVRVRTERIAALNRDYNASRESLDLWAQQLNDQRRAFGEDIVAAFVGLEDVLEPQEWNSVVGLMLEEEARWKALLD